jgi:hypothetical protein
MLASRPSCVLGARRAFARDVTHILAGVALLIGIPVCNAQRGHTTPPEAAPAYR